MEPPEVIICGGGEKNQSWKVRMIVRAERGG